MATELNFSHQTNLFGNDLLTQLDARDPLIKLADTINWMRFEKAFSKHYSHGIGAPHKPIRLMVGLLLLKQLENLSDESVVLQFKRNPYYQYFCGLTEYSAQEPCHSTELVKFRNRIGKQGIQELFQMSIDLHGKRAQQANVHIDTTVQEKNITYPTDSKLAIKIINRCHKLAHHHGIQLRRTYAKEIKSLRLLMRHFRHSKKRAKAKKSLKRLRTIAHTLIRELRRKLPSYLLFEMYQKQFLFYEKVLKQQRSDKNKIYSLHEPQVYCIGKGKDHKAYEYGSKLSIASTVGTNIIVGVVSHEKNIYDGDTLPEILEHITQSRGKSVTQAVVDRGYRGRSKVNGVEIILPKPPLKRDTRYQRDKKRKQCRARASIEPIIGHLKSDYRLSRNLLKGVIGDHINGLLSATAWNLKQWIRAFLYFFLALRMLVKSINKMSHIFLMIKISK